MGTLVLLVGKNVLNQVMGNPPAPVAGTGTVEDRECLVSGRTDSITRLRLSALLTLPAMPQATHGAGKRTACRGPATGTLRTTGTPSQGA